MKELCDECGSFFLLLLKMQNLIIDGKRIKAFHPKEIMKMNKKEIYTFVQIFMEVFEKLHGL